MKDNKVFCNLCCHKDDTEEIIKINLLGLEFRISGYNTLLIGSSQKYSFLKGK